MTSGKIRALLGVVVAMSALVALGQGAAVAYQGMETAFCLLAWWSARRRPAELRRVRQLIALTLTCYLVGDAVDYVFQRIGPADKVSPAEVFWLCSYLTFGGALTLMVRRRAPGQLRAAVLDGAVLTCAAAVATWRWVVVPLLPSGNSSLEILLAVAYPLADVALLAVVLVLVLSPGRHGPATRMLVASVALTLVVDMLYSTVPVWLSDLDITRVDAIVLIANGLLVAAMLHPSAPDLTTSVPVRLTTLHPARVLLLGAALLTAPLVAVMAAKMSPAELVVLIAGMSLAIGLVLARFHGAVRGLEQAQRELVHRAAHDELTGLANRSRFTDALAGCLDRQPVVLFLDLDGFKAVNDSGGHAAGDAVLIAVADRMRAETRATDVVARLGGDEFALLCASADLAQATRLADRLIQAVTGSIEHAGRRYEVGVSIGIADATFAIQPNPIEHLLSAADTAMYQAKRLGRRRWAVAGPTLGVTNSAEAAGGGGLAGGATTAPSPKPSAHAGAEVGG